MSWWQWAIGIAAVLVLAFLIGTPVKQARDLDADADRDADHREW